MKTIYPKPIKAGDTIGVIAPASTPLMKNIEKSKHLYEKWGSQL